MIGPNMTTATNLPLSMLYRRVLRLAGVMAWCWLYLSLQKIPDSILHSPDLQSQVAWTALCVAFLFTLWASTSANKMFERFRNYFLAVEVFSTFYIHLLQPQGNVAFLALIVTWQLILFCAPRVAIAWIAAHFLLYLVVDTGSVTFTWMTAIGMGVYVCFKLSTCILIFMAKQEGLTRLHHEHVISELKATQEAMAESSRLSERLRIARELHDALGHGLTALSLHLEVAINQSQHAQVALHVRKAQAATRAMLSDVRGVVDSLRERASTDDLSSALVALTTDLPGLQVHLSKPDDLELDDPEHVHTVIRCIQEIVTNTLKHASARNLWLSMRVEGGALLITALDDGIGGRSQPIAGTGLAMMRERFKALGGTVEVLTAANHGFCVSASLPILQLTGAAS